MARTTGSDGAKTEEAIRKAAIELIAARGFAAVTLRDLGQRVGIQAGSLYRYYPSKNDLLLKIMVTHLEDLLKRWEESAPDTKDPLERLKAFVDFHVRYHLRKPKEVFIANMELRSLLPAHRRIVAGYRHSYEAILSEILQSGVDAKVFSKLDVRVATYAILAMLTGLTAWYREGGRLSKDDLVARYTELVCEGVRGAKGR